MEIIYHGSNTAREKKYLGDSKNDSGSLRWSCCVDISDNNDDDNANDRGDDFYNNVKALHYTHLLVFKLFLSCLFIDMRYIN